MLRKLGGTPTWTIGTLNNGSSATLDIQATVDAGRSRIHDHQHSVTNVALDQTDTDGTEQTRPALRSRSIATSTCTSPRSLTTRHRDEGQTITYTVTVTNNGPAHATNVSLDDVLPSEV